MIHGVGCINGFDMDVWCILPNLMDYRKSYLWAWGVQWVSYACKWASKSIVSAYLKWNV